MQSDFPQTIKYCFIPFVGLSSVDTITRECLPQMGECGEKVLGNVGEDGRRNLHTEFFWIMLLAIFISGKPLVVEFP